MRDIEREALSAWIEATLAEIDQMGADDPPQKPKRAPNGRYIKKGGK